MVRSLLAPAFGPATRQRQRTWLLFSAKICRLLLGVVRAGAADDGVIAPEEFFPFKPSLGILDTPVDPNSQAGVL
jgi:hypothetical protein